MNLRTLRGFAIHRASDDGYLPTGLSAGTAEDALDIDCGLHLADPNAGT